MGLPKVFLCEGDNIGWAIDDDLARLKDALTGVVEFCDLAESEVVHAVWWDSLLKLSPEKLAEKRIICHVSGEPFRYMTFPRFHRALAEVGRWITQTSQARNQFRSLGFDSELIPYAVNTEIFRPIECDDHRLDDLCRKWDIPRDRYLIGNFHRDTEGRDLSSPKLVKGPDIFVEIVSKLRSYGLPIHVVLAGPRRFWMRRKLLERDIPFTFVGDCVEEDDVKTNRLSRETLNLLYNIIDLYLVSSRSEGGPRSLIEAAATRCKVLSTPVGLAHDVLDPSCIYDDFPKAVEIIAEDYRGSKTLSVGVQDAYERVETNHVADANRPLFEDVYKDIDAIPQFKPTATQIESHVSKARQGLIQRAVKMLLKYKRTPNVSLVHGFVKPPYGGGNQFMIGLQKGLRRQNAIVRRNALSDNVDVYVLNSIHFDMERFLAFSNNHPVRVVHRIDGPIHLIRGYDKEKDDICYGLNRDLAAATVIQSNWTYERIVASGYKPVNAVIINNGVDPDIFHRKGRASFSRNRKIRLISASWSGNPRKGGAVYKWLDDNLDWDRFEYTFVGRSSEPFEKIKKMKPVHSNKLGKILRQHDVFITASQNDPCSNAVLEALACGLPVLYLNDGGHPELVGHGGLPFSSTNDILSQLELLIEDYESFQNLIAVSTICDVAKKYLALLKDVADSNC